MSDDSENLAQVRTLDHGNEVSGLRIRGTIF